MAILPDFRVLENENPYVHVKAFEEVIGSFYAQNVIEIAKLRFFPFSLKEKAKGWLYTVKPRSIGSWGEMTQEFYKKFFPSHKVQHVKRKISSFVQGHMRLYSWHGKDSRIHTTSAQYMDMTPGGW